MADDGTLRKATRAQNSTIDLTQLTCAQDRLSAC
jgi:hypothetical protein